MIRCDGIDVTTAAEHETFMRATMALARRLDPTCPVHVPDPLQQQIRALAEPTRGVFNAYEDLAGRREWNATVAGYFVGLALGRLAPTVLTPT
jgi:hypothetical protein